MQSLVVDVVLGAVEQALSIHYEPFQPQVGYDFTPFVTYNLILQADSIVMASHLRGSGTHPEPVLLKVQLESYV